MNKFEETMGEWWHVIRLPEHDDMHDISLRVVWLDNVHFRSSFVGAYSSQISIN